MTSYEGFTVKLLGAGVLSWFLQLHPLFYALLGLMVLDIVSGLGVAYVTQKIDSTVSRRGAARKAMAWIIVATAAIVGANIENLSANTIPNMPLGRIVTAFYCVHEAISILENCARAGLPVPKFLIDALDKLKKTDSEEKK